MTTAVEGKHRKKPAQKPFFQRIALPVIIILAGLMVLMYPVVATQWNNRVQEQVAKQYEEQIQEAPPEQINQALEAAKEYNRTHTDGPILDPWLARISEDNLDYQEYEKHLEGVSAMSQLAIPSIDLRLPVYHGTRDETLQKGLGHLYGSALPTGGEGFHSVITGHTGLTNATLFDDLVDVEVGDAIYLSTFGERMKYQVYDIEVVLPEETDSLRAEEGRDLLTLITCTPYGINTHRLLVHAERVPMDPDEASVLDESTSTVQWWMWALGLVALAILLGLAWWIWREKKKNDRAGASNEEV
ncbi:MULTISPECIES: class C sortase [Corynebacterium]|uniref:Class C sortase n=1 Tax=Corynebacterium gottingense TaxID=2041036 RepID=A0ABX9ULQ5_9CORY|nr:MULTISPECIES: class C sortase [Corynebacterium]PAT03393.1 class C sortase [Corynebacterium sp. NML 150383]RMD19955.1 class C sortase [Corynebacterium gottingense]WJZ13929.1 Sortase family protein [Corynebacterium gottingense]WJZ16244.1 Sortase family protein [Corynebacterium gottingense]